MWSVQYPTSSYLWCKGGILQLQHDNSGHQNEGCGVLQIGNDPISDILTSYDIPIHCEELCFDSIKHLQDRDNQVSRGRLILEKHVHILFGNDGCNHWQLHWQIS